MRDALGSARSVLVVGGTSDIGLATARALIASGARRVVLAGRRNDALAAAAHDLRGTGAQVETAGFDALDTDAHPAQVERWFAAGDLDVVVLAFGVLGEHEVAARDPRAALHVVRTNYVGAVSVGVPLAQALYRQGHGALVILSSAAGVRARPSNWVYGSSKAGLDAFAEGLSHALDGSGVNVLTVRPGFVHTKMTAGHEPAPLSTTAEAVADAIVGGLRSRREVVWVPGALRWVMLVIRALPRPVLRRLAL
ncbi:MAG TPA: decaprenylphospho-beta-D-erythro-pentofuranosid-2-ulose 2-reductase [Nitriliruptorales bacterium]|nr:decaprenylphospho-beta-D-erythro-pentofuranosid-2-ulose 2-reductase [Nitriliruptorales bacterium]